MPIEREEVVSIAKDVRQEAERLGQELDPAGEVLFEVKCVLWLWCCRVSDR